MREFEYRLVKEDYKDWIHWNVEKNFSEKKRQKTLVIYGLIILAFAAMSIITGKGLNGVIPTLVLGVLMGWYLMRTTSFQNQEKMIWKKSGLEKLDKTGNYPTVHLILKDRGLVMEVAEQNMSKIYGYNEIISVIELERLFLLEATDKTWQFVSKSAFESEEEKEAFVAFMNEKIAAAKEAPEEYSQEAMKREAGEALTDAKESCGEEKEAAGEISETEEERENTASSAEEEDAVVIEPVDTSNMGKIGKMAHIMAAMAAENGEKPVQDAEKPAEDEEKPVGDEEKPAEEQE
ncbi:MAG: YcxB family protein [Otoolea sp.]|nr:YcxB family protein [Clostridiaceae bacterium]MDY5484928.1 YcxB family protein [Clostridium sp.]